MISVHYTTTVQPVKNNDFGPPETIPPLCYGTARSSRKSNTGSTGKSSVGSKKSFDDGEKSKPIYVGKKSLYCTSCFLLIS